MQRVIKNSDDLTRLFAFLGDAQQPFTVSFVKGGKRSNPANALTFKWYAEIAQQRGDTRASEVRAESKLRFGVPILRRDDAEFRDKYDASFKPLPYEMKLRAFEALEPEVTSKMTVPQMSEYMDNMSQYYRERGFFLSDPRDLGRE